MYKYILLAFCPPDITPVVLKLCINTLIFLSQSHHRILNISSSALWGNKKTVRTGSSDVFSGSPYGLLHIRHKHLPTYSVIYVIKHVKCVHLHISEQHSEALHPLPYNSCKTIVEIWYLHPVIALRPISALFFIKVSTPKPGKWQMSEQKSMHGNLMTHYSNTLAKQARYLPHALQKQNWLF